MIFQFIKDATETIDILYNLILFDSIVAIAYIGYRSIMRIFSHFRKSGRRGASDKC